MPHDFLQVAIGAALGGSLRHRILKGAVSPRGSLVRVCTINAAGSFLLGVTASLYQKKMITKHMSLAMGTGFCGGFTTFSTFAAQIVDSISSDGNSLAGGYAAASCLLGIAGVILGRSVGRRLML